MATVSTVTYDSLTDTNAITITLASLATSATLVAGRESTIVSNVSALYMDAIVAGQITTGTSPSAANIQVFVYAPIKNVSSTWTLPKAGGSVLTGADAAATFDAAQIQAIRLAYTTQTNTTSDRAYTVPPFSVAALFGGVLPIKWGLWIVHNTGVNLNSTGSNHWMHYTGIKYTST